MEQSAQSGEQMQVMAVVLRAGHEEEIGQSAVGCPKANALGSAGDDQDGLGNGVRQGATGVGQGDAVFQGGAAEFFAFTQGFEECLGVVELFGFLSQGDQFAEDAVFGFGVEVEFNGSWAEQRSDDGFGGIGLAVGGDAGVHAFEVIFF